MYKAYNDYELLYLVKEKDTVALDILLKKYERFIYKKVYSFFFHDDGDYFQEGVLCLYKAIETFDDRYNKTFMRYFEVILTRHFINIYNKNKRYLQMIESCKQAFLVQETEEAMLEIPLERPIFKSQTEQKIYELYYINNKKVKEISGLLNLNAKQIYNAIYRIKHKLLDIYQE